MTEKHAGGRPLKFKTVEELQQKIDDYFNNCDPHPEDVTEWVDAREQDGKLKKDENGLNYLVEVSHKIMTKQIPYTITGLALALDTTRRTLLDYEEMSDEFSHTIKAAKARCEFFAENMLFTPSPTGTIFSLKNNYEWKDKTEQENSGEQKIIVETRRYDPNNKED